MTISGPAIKAAKNPSSASTFIALPPLQLLRKSPRRSTSASVRGSFWVKVFMGNHPHEAAFVSASILRGIRFREQKTALVRLRLIRACLLYTSDAADE